MEDLGRELVSTLDGDAARQAILLAKAPSDFVTANRTLVADGDQVIPLAGVWRDEQFPDPRSTRESRTATGSRVRGC